MLGASKSLLVIESERNEMDALGWYTDPWPSAQKPVFRDLATCADFYEGIGCFRDERRYVGLAH